MANLPPGYAAVPLSRDQMRAPVRLCALVRREPDAVAGSLVVLRDTIAAKVYLGCLADSAGQVHRWLEISVQDLEAISSSAAVWRTALTNALLDKRWEMLYEGLKTTDPSGVITTGWETAPPLPVFLDLNTLEPVHPVETSSRAPWRLCTDDALLAGAQLPTYSGSLARYLYVPELGNKTPFVPATADAPENDRTRALDSLEGRALAPLNAGGGRMMVCAHAPVGLEPFLALLGGAPWDGAPHGKSIVDVGGLAEALRAGGAAGRLFLGASGRSGRLLETLHLKLRLLADAVSAVRNAIQCQQRPLLNITADSFRVDLEMPAPGLPYLWTARTLLTSGGEAIELPVPASDLQYYGRAGAGVSAFWPSAIGVAARGRSVVRIREVLPMAADRTIIEGTFFTQEPVRVAANDIVWLRLTLGCGRVDLYARFDTKRALAAGEWRFRTVGQRFPEIVAQHLRAAPGVPFADSPFEVVPLLSAPCDLYALAVLAVRALLVNSQTTLAIALDEVLSLARQAGAEQGDPKELAAAIRTICERDERWVQSLGPHRVTEDAVSPKEAFDFIPPEVWWDALAMVVRMIPAMGGASICRDYGDAPPGGLHKIFERTLNDLDALLCRTRSLIVIDWRQNREIHAVLRQHLTALAGSGR